MFTVLNVPERLIMLVSSTRLHSIFQLFKKLLKETNDFRLFVDGPPPGLQSTSSLKSTPTGPESVPSKSTQGLKSTGPSLKSSSGFHTSSERAEQVSSTNENSAVFLKGTIVSN